MMRLKQALLFAVIGSTLTGCYAYAGPPRHTHERVVVVRERSPKRVVVREKVVVKDGNRRHHHHDHDD